jgi:cobalt/nickel transport system permease protein
MAAGAAGLIAYSARKVTAEMDERKAPLMGVMGAFVFAAQMINFTIPGTGSSGHLGGGMMLSILLGPYAAFLTIASVLVVQALVFADGGLLALGCNIVNLGLFPAFICYPLIYKRLAPAQASPRRVMAAALISSVIALQLGALGVVLVTILSGRSDLPFGTFALLMLPIHLPIGVVEGLATAAVVGFVQRARPEVLVAAAEGSRLGPSSLKRLLVGMTALAAMVAGVLSWFASTHPDGLEWSLFKATGSAELVAPAGGLHEELSRIQEQTAVMPDYALVEGEATDAEAPAATSGWKARAAGTSVAGLVGGAITLGLVTAIGLAVRALSRAGRGGTTSSGPAAGGP